MQIFQIFQTAFLAKMRKKTTRDLKAEEQEENNV